MKRMETFRALVSRGDGKGENTLAVEEMKAENLKKSDVTIRVHYSSLNYKDALSAQGHTGITRSYPHVPGIDAAGVVMSSGHTDFRPGDEVLVTGYDLGMNTFGGFGQVVSVPSDWVIRIPQPLSTKQAMMLGTAGFTAALSIWKLSQLNIRGGRLLVTGASGGVGSIAVMLGHKLGFEVHACSRSEDRYEALKEIGATEISPYEKITDSPEKPLYHKMGDAAIDTVGGSVLSGLIRCIDKEGAVAVCGNAGGDAFQTTVFPMILRGISLLGIDSGHIGRDVRKEVWSLLADKWDVTETLNTISREVELEDLPEAIETMLKGNSWGRTIIRHWE